MLNAEQKKDFCLARRRVIAREFSRLNPEQLMGVLATEGPLLLLAGAGSGKTTVLIDRIANLIRYGRASDSGEVPGWVTEEDLYFLRDYSDKPHPGGRERAEDLCKLDPAPPWTILAITFTNKAAGELKARLEQKLGHGAQDIWAATFHSACVRILRRDIDKLGFPSSFTIYDSADSERVIKDILRDWNFDDKLFAPRSVLKYISQAKDAVEAPAEYISRCEKTGDHRLIKIGQIYQEYQRRLKDAAALDFDDLILCTVSLLRQHKDARDYYQNKFRYVLVDEYQDTNNLQYLLTSILAARRRNICVVGDDDQSIYRFRGATIENILSFEKQYKDARVIRLEQNYRSTGMILEASNAVIRNNEGRRGKRLWTEQPPGEKLRIYNASSELDEAQYTAAQMLTGYSTGRAWKEFAVLYRMNAQSNQLEMACKRNGIPYRIMGGTRFFDRAEVKDMLAYLCVLHNPHDDLRLVRIINTPPRRIGGRTVERAQGVARETGRSLWDVVCTPREYPALQKTAANLSQFTEMMRDLRAAADKLPLTEFYEEVLSRTGYAAMLAAKNTVEDRTRLENVRELQSSISDYERQADEPSLAGFLDTVALYTDLDSQDTDEEGIVMMTMHSAKGLEFPVVFMVGMEEGVFPGARAAAEPDELEEERRLCYVAMTRAREQLHLTCAAQRMLFGRTTANRPSRFLQEIPPQTVEGLRLESAYTLRREPKARPAAVKKAPASFFTPTSAPPSLKKGEVVTHSAFGRGMVLSVQPMGGDALLEIAFDEAGTRRLMLKAAAKHLTKSG